MKKLLSFLLVFVLVCGLAVGIAACNPDSEEDKTPLKETLVKGAWESEVYGDDTHTLKDDIVFHNDGIFYTTTFGGKIPAAGYWTVTEESKTMTNYEDYELGDEETYTFPAYITLTTFSGEPYGTSDTEMDEFKQQGIYGIKDDVIYGVMYQTMRWYHKTDKTVEEEPVTVVSFFNGIVTNSLELGHNGKFSDSLDGQNYYEGTWSYDAATKTYTLTSTEGTATLKLSADGKTAEYKRGNVTLTVTNANAAKTILHTFEASDPDIGNFTLYLYEDDNSCEIFMGTVSRGEGTWTEAGGHYTINIASLGINNVTSTTNKDGVESFEIALGGGLTFVEVVDLSSYIKFAGTFQINGTFDGTVEAILYSDYTVVINSSVDMSAVPSMGVVNKTENGTWALADLDNGGGGTFQSTSALVITIPVDGGDDIVYNVGKEEGAENYSFVYKYQTSDGFVDVTMTLDATMKFSGQCDIRPEYNMYGKVEIYLNGSMAGGTALIFTDAGMMMGCKVIAATWTMADDYSTITITIPVKDGDDIVYTAVAQPDHSFKFTFTLEGQMGTVVQTYQVEMTGSSALAKA